MNPLVSVEVLGSAVDLASATHTSSSFLVAPSSSFFVLAETGSVDPTTVLNDVLGGLTGGPVILAVPIIAALAVATLLAALIVNSAAPEASEDEDEDDDEFD